MDKKKLGLIIAVIFVAVIALFSAGDGETETSSTTTELVGTSSEYKYEYEQSTQADDEASIETSGHTQTEAETKQTENKKETTTAKVQQSSGNYKVSLNSIPAFSGKAYVVVNNNIPGLSANDRSGTYFEKYTPLDSLGRCGVAFACLGKETMPTEERGAIGSVKPSGWHTVKYDIVDGKYLYNRCHLIGFQLSAENANTRNLITGTRYMNVQGMLPFENMVADYIKETNNHVLYRVTPVFKGNELVCRGVQLEAYSVEDNGDGICFNVFCYNSQPGITIDYATGESFLDEVKTTSAPTTTKKTETTTKEQTTAVVIEDDEASEMVWIPQSGSKYHSKSTCSKMKDPTRVTLSEAKAQGFTPCGRCY